MIFHIMPQVYHNKVGGVSLVGVVPASAMLWVVAVVWLFSACFSVQAVMQTAANNKNSLIKKSLS